MTNTNVRYEPINSNFCGYSFVSIRVDGVDYYPISQLPFDPTGNQGFPARQDEPSQDLKRLLGNDFSSVKILTSLNSKKVNCLPENTLALAVKQFARKKDSEFAWQLLEASFAVQLRLANDHARGVAEEIAYYVELAAMRAEGIKYRRLFTDLIKMQKELGFELNYGYMTLLVYQCTDLIEKYNAWKVVYTTNAERSKFPFRGTLNELELVKLGNFELRCAERAIAKKIAITQAIRETFDFFS